MAGDWIKIRCDLPDDPRVLLIAQRLGISTDEVLGKLVRFWVWVNRYMRDSVTPHVTPASVDCHAGIIGFFQALHAVNWIDTTGTRITIPNFEEHNWTQPQYSQTPGAIRQRRRREKLKQKGDINSRDKRDTKALHVTLHALPTYTCTSLEENPLSPLQGVDKCSSEKTPPEIIPTGEVKHTPEKQNPKEEKKDQESQNIPFRGMPCDKPELAVIAKRVVEHYRKTVRSPHPWGSSTTRIIELLGAGHTEEQLRQAANYYAKHCERNNTENRHRQGAAKFYSDSGEYEAFKDYQPEPEKPKNILRPPRPEKLRHEEIPPQIVGDLFDKKDQSKEG